MDNQDAQYLRSNTDDILKGQVPLVVDLIHDLIEREVRKAMARQPKPPDDNFEPIRPPTYLTVTAMGAGFAWGRLDSQFPMRTLEIPVGWTPTIENRQIILVGPSNDLRFTARDVYHCAKWLPKETQDR